MHTWTEIYNIMNTIPQEKLRLGAFIPNLYIEILLIGSFWKTFKPEHQATMESPIGFTKLVASDLAPQGRYFKGYEVDVQRLGRDIFINFNLDLNHRDWADTFAYYVIHNYIDYDTLCKYISLVNTFKDGYEISLFTLCLIMKQTQLYDLGLNFEDIEVYIRYLPLDIRQSYLDKLVTTTPFQLYSCFDIHDYALLIEGTTYDTLIPEVADLLSNC